MNGEPALRTTLPADIEQWIMQVKQGRKEAYRTIIEFYQVPLYRYAYQLLRSRTKPGMVRWSYRKKNLEIRMSATLDIPIKPLFSDDKPSADSVVNLKGVDAYFYRDAVTGERSLIWSELLPSGHYRLYTAMTRNATDSDLKKFAEAVISTQ
jgi:hypothetical protein